MPTCPSCSKTRIRKARSQRRRVLRWQCRLPKGNKSLWIISGFERLETFFIYWKGAFLFHSNYSLTNFRFTHHLKGLSYWPLFNNPENKQSSNEIVFFNFLWLVCPTNRQNKLLWRNFQWKIVLKYVKNAYNFIIYFLKFIFVIRRVKVNGRLR